LSYDYDLFVIGGGSGGVRAARMSAGHGAKVALAEESRLGGTCVNVGCVPKKLLSYAAHYSEEIRDAASFGWTVAGRPSFDWATLKQNKDEEIARLNEVYGGVLERAGVEVVGGRAHVTGPHEVRVGDREITAAEILVATGGQPWAPPIPGAEHGVFSDAMFFLEELPKRVVVAGGGYVGVEFASILNGLGVEVWIVHKYEHLLTAFDDDVQTHLTEQIRLKGVHVHGSHTIEEIALEGGTRIATLDDGAKLEADLVLAAVGRRPRARGFGLEEVGVELGANGGIVVDDELRSTVPSISALGDVIDRVMLTPVALEEGMAFARHRFAGEPMRLDYDNIPTAVFSNPEVGSVGLSEQAAWRRGEVCEIYRSVFRPMKHTLTGHHDKMLMKLVVCAKTNRVLGLHVVGPDAGEIVQGFAVAMKCGVTKAQIDSTIGIHPTAAEELVTMREPVGA
jgi:glutathione reductase (NADPH)